jgi:hypothetical protein
MQKCLPIFGPLLSLALAGCSVSPPRIGEDLHGPIAAIQSEFDRRVKTRFPVGSDETLLRHELERERFVIMRDQDAPFSFSARYTSGGIACRVDWVIRWSIYAEKIADAAGQWGQTCL